MEQQIEELTKRVLALEETVDYLNIINGGYDRQILGMMQIFKEVSLKFTEIEAKIK